MTTKHTEPSTRSGASDIRPCPHCGDPMKRYPLKGSIYPDYACLCGYEGDGGLPRTFTKAERKEWTHASDPDRHETRHISIYVPKALLLADPSELTEIKIRISYRRYNNRYQIQYIDGLWPEQIDMLLADMAHNENVPVTQFTPRLKSHIQPWLKHRIAGAFPEMKRADLVGLHRCVVDAMRRERSPQ